MLGDPDSWGLKSRAMCLTLFPHQTGALSTAWGESHGWLKDLAVRTHNRSIPPTAADFGLSGEVVGDPVHGGQVILSLLDVMEGLDVVGLVASGNEVLESSLVLPPLGDLEVDGGLDGLGSLRLGLAGAGLLLGGLLLNIALSLAATGRGGGARGGRGSSLSGGAVVIVDAPHVVPEVPLSGESVAGNGALAALIGAQVGLLTMAMHRVGLTLMSEEASSGRKAGVLATLNLAAVGLEVGVNKLAVGGRVVS